MLHEDEITRLCNRHTKKLMVAFERNHWPRHWKDDCRNTMHEIREALTHDAALNGPPPAPIIRATVDELAHDLECWLFGIGCPADIRKRTMTEVGWLREDLLAVVDGRVEVNSKENMNTYIAAAKRECEIGIVKALREFERVNAVEVSAINFVRQALCDTDGQKINTWDVSISCKPNKEITCK